MLRLSWSRFGLDVRDRTRQADVRRKHDLFPVVRESQRLAFEERVAGRLCGHLHAQAPILKDQGEGQAVQFRRQAGSEREVSSADP